jgi:hypothetical protein
MKEWTVKIGKYSLKSGEIGKPIGEPITRAYLDPADALRDLNSAIDAGAVRLGGAVANSYHIVTPDGRDLTFNAAYLEVFGEKPVHHDNQADTYPCLKTRRPK